MLPVPRTCDHIKLPCYFQEEPCKAAASACICASIPTRRDLAGWTTSISLIRPNHLEIIYNLQLLWGKQIFMIFVILNQRASLCFATKPVKSKAAFRFSNWVPCVLRIFGGAWRKQTMYQWLLGRRIHWCTMADSNFEAFCCICVLKILLLWPKLSEAMDALACVIFHLCRSSITVQTCADSLPLSSIFSYLKLLKSSALFNSEHGTGWQTAFDTTSVSCEDCPYQPKCPPTCSSLRLSHTCMCKLSMLGHACL